MAFRTNKMPVLQEKLASGAVATFNTALAMPLPSCNIAVNAWQEGTGDPSPSNVRAIHGFSEVNICNTSGLAEWFKGIYQGIYGFIELSSLSWSKTSGDNYFFLSSNVPNFKQYAQYYVIPNFICPVYDVIGTQSSPQQELGITVNINSSQLRVKDSRYTDATDFKNSLSGIYLIYELATPTTPTITDAQFNALLSSFNINGVHYLVTLGQEVYGAEVDVVNGVAHVTYITERIDHVDTVTSSYIKSDACDGFITLSNCPSISTADTQYNVLCNYFARLVSAYGIWSRVGYPNKFQTNSNQVHLNIANDLLGITDYTQETPTTAKAKMNAWLSNNIVMINRPLLTPFDIQLTPTQIETIAGKTNTIFADTGDVDLTYKDLDIAKRGNFREVFKLPS